jgi:hypothetical protein
MERLPPELLFQIFAQLELSHLAALYIRCGDQSYVPLITLMAAKLLKNLVTSAPYRTTSVVDSVGLPCKSKFFEPAPPFNEDLVIPLEDHLWNADTIPPPNIFGFGLHHSTLRRTSSPNGMSIGRSSDLTWPLSLTPFHLCFHGVATAEMISTELMVEERDSEGSIRNTVMVGYSTLNLPKQADIRESQQADGHSVRTLSHQMHLSYLRLHTDGMRNWDWIDMPLMWLDFMERDVDVSLKFQSRPPPPSGQSCGKGRQNCRTWNVTSFNVNWSFKTCEENAKTEVE